MRFNPPPNWPKLPDDFTPPADWQPDPRWGGVPYGWALWIDDDGRSMSAPALPLRAPVRRTSSGRSLFLLIAVGVIAWFAYSYHKHTTAEHQVIYTVDGDNAPSGLIDYVLPGGQQQENGQHLPWSHSMTVRGSTTLVLSAQKSNDDGLPIHCRITVDGKVLSDNTSSGAYSIASCNATVS